MSGKPFIALLITDPGDYGTSQTLVELPLDVRKSSTYHYPAEVTRFPVEDGGQIGDHVANLPVEISIEGFVTDVPAVAAVPLTNLGGDSTVESQRAAPARTQAAWDAIMKVRREKTSITVVTEYEVLENMMIADLSFPRSSEQGTGLWFSMQLTQVTIVSSVASSIPPAVLKKLKTGAGKKQSTNAKLAKYRAQLQGQVVQGQMTKAEAEQKSAAYAQTLNGKFKK